MTPPLPRAPILLLLTSLLFAGACAAETSPCPVGTARRSDGACLRGCRPDEVNDLGGCNCPPPLVERREDGRLFCEFVGDEPLPDAGPMDAPRDMGAAPDSGPMCVEGSSCEPEVECQLGRVVCDAEEARCVVDQAAPDGSDCAGCSTGTCTCQAGRCQATLLGESEYLKPPDISAFDSFGGSFGQGLAMSADGSTIVAGAPE